MTLALLYPGQGVQSPGFLHRLPTHPAVRSTIEEASATLDRNVLELDSADALHSTVAVQVALIIAGVACARVLAHEGLEAGFHAGLSVGAYAAAVGCGAVAFGDALRMAHKRAELMEAAYPSGYGMTSVLGLNETQVEALAAAHARAGRALVHIANVNAPRQIIVAGADADLAAFAQSALAAGARRAQCLAVAVPSHCQLLADAAAELSAWSRAIPFHTPHAIYASNRGGRPLRDGDAIRSDLAANMRYTVRWFDALTMMAETGATIFVEAPPGQVLTDIVRENCPKHSALSAEAMGPDRLAAVIRRRLQAN